MAARGAKSKVVEQVEKTATLEAVKALDTAKVIEEVNNLQVSLQGTLANVGASITNKIAQIGTIDQAISLKESRLKELFDIEAKAVQLDELEAQRKQAFEDWQKEKEERQLQFNEEEQETNKTRERNEEDWNYSFEQKKMRAEAEFKAMQESKARAEKVREEIFVKSLTERDAAMKAKEVEFTELKKKVEGMDATVKAEVDKAVAIATNSVKKTFDHEKILLEKDTAMAKTLAEQQVQARDAQIASLKAQLEDVKAQLVSALKDTKEIATNAVTAASGREVANALRQVVDSREQGQGKSGK